MHAPTPPLDIDCKVDQVNSVLDRKLHPRSWPDALRISYFKDKDERTYPELRYLLVAGLFVTIATSLLDLAHSRALAAEGMQLRLGIVVPVILAGLVIGREDRIWAAVLAVCLSQLLFALVVLHLSFSLPPVAATHYIMSTAIILGLSNILFPMRMPVLLVYNLVFILSQFGWATFLSERHWASHFDFAIITLGISLGTLALSERVERLQARNYLLRLQHQFAAEQLQHTNAILRDLSNRDPLTGLANRRHFETQFAQRFAMPALAENAPPVAVMLIDLDHFKAVNDRHGHQAGDECLRQSARAMEAVIAAHDGILGRFGGEEFVAVIREDTPDKGAFVAEALRRRVEELRVACADYAPDRHFSVTASIGVSVSGHRDYSSLSQLLGAADLALYDAKDAGRNQVMVAYQPDNNLRLIA